MRLRRPARHSGHFARRLAGPLHLAEHFGEQLHGQTDHIRLASFNHADPSELVLIAERTGLALPRSALQISVLLAFGKGIHLQGGNRHADKRFAFPFVPEAKTRQHPMAPSPER